MRCVTTVSRRELPFARALAASLATAWPRAELWVAVVDDPLGLAPIGPARHLALPSAPPGGPSLGALRAAAPDDETFAHVVRPWAAASVLGAGTVLVLAPRTLVPAPLTPLVEAAGADGVAVAAGASARAGAPGPHGALGTTVALAGPAGAGFAERWFDHLTTALIAGRPGGAELDTLAWAPGVTAVRDDGLDVDAWNAAARGVVRDGATWRCGAAPLRSLGLAGFDPERPYLATTTFDRCPPVLLSEQPALAALYAWASEQIAAQIGPRDEPANDPRRLPSGLRLTAPVAEAHRLALAAAARGDGDLPPDPLQPGGARATIAFLSEPDPATFGRLTRYEHALYRLRPDLQAAFPDVTGRDRPGFTEWLQRYGKTEAGLPPGVAVAPRPAAHAPTPERRPGGVNLAGYLHADLGLGEAARAAGLALTAAGVPVEEIVYRRTQSRGGAVAADLALGAYATNLVCVTADQFHLFEGDAGRPFFEGRRTIGYWWWELETFPEAHRSALALVDEVWVGSEHVRRAIAAVTDKRVERLPVPVVAPQPSWRDRASFAIGPGYAFVFTFDFLSVIERKNPQAVIAAYRTAFGPDDGATLVLKSVNGHQRVDELEALRAAAAGRPDIVVLDEYLTRADQAALLAACDCYVSLHRAEGFGLGMAEAMALGKPVIATGYSGNVDFMNAANSILVGYDRVAVPPGLAIYPAGSEWADPDVEEAAAAMARLAHDPALGARLGARAKDDLGTHWDAATCGRRMHARLHDFWRTDAPVSGP